MTFTISKCRFTLSPALAHHAGQRVIGGIHGAGL
jgi:hypothetical protein